MKSVKCKAAVLYEYGKPLVIEEVTLNPAEPGKGEVKIRVAATSICHSDVHSFRGEHGHPKLPAVGGHEVTGYVEEVGEGVTYDVKPGDRVILALGAIGCGQCYYCVRGFPYMCEKGRPPRPRTGGFQGISAVGRYLNKDGERLTQFGGQTAGFVEQVIVHEDRLVKIPDNMPFDKAAPLACGVMTGYGAVVNLAQVKPRSSVCVVGTGGVGLSAIQGARLSGAYPIIAVDILDNKLEMARRFGATHTVNSKMEKDPINAVWQIAGGRGADYVFVCVGGMDVLRQAFIMSGPGSWTVIIGHHGNDTLSAFEPTDLFGRILTGGGGNARIRYDIPDLIEYYMTGQLKLDEYITGHYPLEKINEAIEDMLSGQGLRPVIMFE
ncbi:MAG: alcohol dehydrogenase catalytic domain-containing protein [Dehalococcoidales bacterium]|nr:alcohol dehydrogenase catalytic domain-containing protein [Dehalococcoidales bacterium]